MRIKRATDRELRPRAIWRHARPRDRRPCPAAAADDAFPLARLGLLPVGLALGASRAARASRFAPST